MISKHGIVFERSYLSLLTHFPGKKKKINRNDLLTWKDYRESIRALFLPLGFCVGIASIGGSKGGRQGRAPPGSKFFHFHAVFGKKLKNNSTFGSWRPPGENPGSATGFSYLWISIVSI